MPGGLFTKLHKHVITPLADPADRLINRLGSATGDVDRLLSYFTRQQVLFLDWQLGAMFWSIQVSMAIIIIGYVLIYNEGYVRFEQAKGAVVTHVAGDAVSTSTGKPATRYFSTEEVTYPGLENGNVFIATRQVVHRQMRGYCEDPDMPCTTDADCGSDQGACSESGLCRSYSWCNVEDKPEIYVLEVDALEVWARSFIQFVKLAPEKVLSTDSNSSQPFGDTVFSVRELLTKVEPLPIHYEEVAHLGGLFDVSMRWECNLSRKKPCKPRVSVRRLDTLFDPDNIGYDFKYAEYIDNDHRLQNEVSGLRFMFRTTGVGKKFSMQCTITTLSTSGTLMSLAIIVCDLLLTKVIKNRKKFIARKFENTPDFSEYMIKDDQRRKERTKLLDIEKAEQAVVEKEQVWIKKFEEENLHPAK